MTGIGLAGVLLLCGCGDAKRERAEVLLREAAKAYAETRGTERDKAQKAMLKVREALALAPDFDEARLKYAALLYDKGNYSGSLKEAGKVVEGGVERDRVTVLAAAALFRLKGTPDLVDTVQANLDGARPRLTLDNLEAIAENLCNGPRGDGKGLDAGIRVYRGMVEDKECEPEIVGRLAVYLAKAGRRAEAIPLLEKAVAAGDLEAEVLTKFKALIEYLKSQK